MRSDEVIDMMQDFKVEERSSETLMRDTASPTGSTTPLPFDLEKSSSENLRASNPNEDTEYKRPISGLSWTFVCVGLLLGAFLYGLDTTIAADIQGPILLSLGEIDKLAWVGIGFPMGSVSVILLFGWCYELFEIKYLIIGSVLLFEIGSAVCASASTMNAMIVGRVIAGAGGSGMYLGALTYVAVFTSLKERPIYNALIGLCWGVGAILGPVVGGGFAETSATWRWAFYINLPLAAFVAPVYIFLFPKHNGRPEISGPTKLRQIDWVGFTLNAGVWTLFQVACTFSGSTWKWNSAGPIALWVVFAVFLISLVVQQTWAIFTTYERRLIPLQLFRSRTIILLYIGASCAATAVAVSIYFVPLFFVFTKGDSAIKAAIRLLPFIAIMIAFIIIAGTLLPIVGRYMPFYVATGIFIVTGGALMHTVDNNTSISTIYGYEVLTAIGAGIGMQIHYGVAVAIVKPSEIMGAIGIMNTAQIGSTAIALSIANSLFQNIGFQKLRDALANRGFSEVEIRGALAGANSAVLTGGDPEVLGLAINAIVETMQTIWILVIVAGATCVVVGVLMKREKLVLAPGQVG